jgi:hypothetical protein
VRISGHTGRIPGSYLHDIFQPRHSSFVAMTQLENYISQPCLSDSIYVIFRVILFNFHEYLPMGVIDVFCWQCGQSSLLKRCDQLCLNLMSINLFFITSFDSSPFFCRLLSIGCAIALPMGVAPEAIAEIFGYRLKKIDKPVLYIFSRVICRLYSPLQWISPL